MGLDLFFKPRLVELGKIKVGAKSEKAYSTAGGGTFRPPTKLDHFVISTMNRDKAGDLMPDTELMEQLAAQYGSPDDGLLRQIPIRLLSNDPEEIMQSAYVWYGGKTVGARSDGLTVTWFNDRATGQRLREPVTEDWDEKFLELKDRKGNRLFKLHTCFNCVIAAKEARWGGVYKFRTTSVISGRQLYGSLLETLRLTGGILIGMPLVLVLRPVQVAPEGKPTTVYVVHVELRGSEMKAIQQQALEQMRYALEFKGEMQRTQAQYRKMLVGPGVEEGDEAKDIAEEFHPETVEAEAVRVPSRTVDPLLEGDAGAEAATGGAQATPAPTASAPAAASVGTPAPAQDRDDQFGQAEEDAPKQVENEVPHAANSTLDAGADQDPLADIQPPDPNAPKPPPAMIGQDQIEDLKILRRELQYTVEEWQALLKEFGVSSGADLTAADALTLILKLRDQRDQKNKRRGKGAAKKEVVNKETGEVAEPPPVTEQSWAKAETESRARMKGRDEMIGAILAITDTWDERGESAKINALRPVLFGMTLTANNYARKATDAQLAAILAKVQEIEGGAK